MTTVVVAGTLRSARFIARGLRGVGVRADILVNPEDAEAVRIAVDDGRGSLRLSEPTLRELRASGFDRDTIKTAQGMFCFEDLADLVLAPRPGDTAVLGRHVFPLSRQRPRGARSNPVFGSHSTTSTATSSPQRLR